MPMPPDLTSYMFIIYKKKKKSCKIVIENKWLFYIDIYIYWTCIILKEI